MAVPGGGRGGVHQGHRPRDLRGRRGAPSRRGARAGAQHRGRHLCHLHGCGGSVQRRADAYVAEPVLGSVHLRDLPGAVEIDGRRARPPGRDAPGGQLDRHPSPGGVLQRGRGVGRPGGPRGAGLLDGLAALPALRRICYRGDVGECDLAGLVREELRGAAGAGAGRSTTNRRRPVRGGHHLHRRGAPHQPHVFRPRHPYRGHLRLPGCDALAVRGHAAAGERAGPAD
mmetsp:Transcript_7454/g.18324  ORF Transcript_7454/g.18324 Transcript_7454/m.18324 type:complete len:228 (+) Transcript_7454:200-883(+)